MIIGLYHHPWFVWRDLSTSVVCLKDFIPISVLFERLYPDNNLIQLQCYYPQWRLLSVCTAMSVHFPSYSSSFVKLHLLQRVVHSYIHAYTSYIQHHSYMIALVTQSPFWSYPFGSVLTHPQCQANSLRNIFCAFWTRLILCQYLLCLLDQVNPLPIFFVPFGPG